MSKSNKKEELDFDSWEKKDLIEYIRKNINNKKENNTINIDTQNKNKGKKKGNREFDFTKCSYRYIALKIAYFGWNYQGFAAQAEDCNVSTIEGHLFDALKTLKLIQDRKTCHYSLCGRTDKGVSAFSQIVGLYVRSALKNDLSKGIYSYDELKKLKKNNIPPVNDPMDISNDEEKDSKEDNNISFTELMNESVIQATEHEMDYVNMLNRLLPSDIRILAWSPIKSTFNARYGCSYRKYHYFFSSQDLDIELMQKACKKFEGQHDFRNFCKIDPTKPNKFERTIYSCSIFKANDISQIGHSQETKDISSSSNNNNHPFDIYTFEIKGMAFLWHQVRCCMAILFLIGKHKENIDIIDKLFDVNNEKDQGKPIYDLAPEIPLVLVDTGYPKNTFYWINDRNPISSKNETPNYINYIKNLSLLLETWQNEAIKLSQISKLILDHWNFQSQMNQNFSGSLEDNTRLLSQNRSKFLDILKYIQSYNLDGWYNSKRMQKIPIKSDISAANTSNYVPLLKRKKCNSFNEAYEKKKLKKGNDSSIKE